MELMRLIYSSEATPRLDDIEFASMVSRADDENRLQGIVGIIGMEAGHIMQVIEGSSIAVLRLFERIRRDPRHDKVELRVEYGIESITVSDWGMWIRPMDEVQALSRRTPETQAARRDN